MEFEMADNRDPRDVKRDPADTDHPVGARLGRSRVARLPVPPLVPWLGLSERWWAELPAVSPVDSRAMPSRT